MRVLLMNHFPLTGSGSGVYTRNIARALVRKGHEVCIILPENEELVQLEEDEVRYHPVYFNGCTSDALEFNFPCFTTHPRSTTTFYELEDEQIDAYKMAFRKALAYEIECFEPDIIHCGHIWIQAACAADFDIPLIITAHGTDLIGFEKTERFRAEAKKAYRAARAIVAISQDNAELVKELFGEPEKIHLIRNGYDPSVFYPEPTTAPEILKYFGIESECEYDTIIAFAGKFTHFKGIDILLDAAALYERETVATLLAGDGELFDEMTALAARRGLRHTYFLRHQNHDALRRLYSSATMSLLPSRNEAFGLVAIEAMACGAPVVASNEGGPRDIITPEVGLLFEPESPEGLARKVTLILDGDIAFDHDAIAAFALANYSQEHSIDELIALYEAAQG